MRLRCFCLIFSAVYSSPPVSAQLYSYLHHDGILRSYILHVPPSFSASDTLPLVVCLHGLYQSP
ncbi:MAG TPA: hypothetical protein VNJ07_08305, partial [Chitinophagales bacterium]|nr:hypothetical protein [Chitinophagales bacterium]